MKPCQPMAISPPVVLSVAGVSTVMMHVPVIIDVHVPPAVCRYDTGAGAREALRAAVPSHHQQLLRELRWVHQQPLPCVPGMLVAVHAGLHAETPLGIAMPPPQPPPACIHE
jgi:hypothetical protein